MLSDQWFQCLNNNFVWLKDHQENPDVLAIVRRILESDDYRDVTEVFDSSVWAVCHAYKDYKLATHFLSPYELEYTQGRSGIIGTSIVNGEIMIATIRDFLEEYDYGFKLFMLGQRKPPAA